MPETEVKLWRRLKGRQLSGYKIRRQYGIGKYVIDFYCPKLKMGIEIDGDSHFTVKGINHDKVRNNYIKKEGINLIRIPSSEVNDNLDGVIKFISGEFEKCKDRW